MIRISKLFKCLNLQALEELITFRPNTLTTIFGDDPLGALPHI
jgi:hypothetical protein